LALRRNQWIHIAALASGGKHHPPQLLHTPVFELNHASENIADKYVRRLGQEKYPGD
jgi:hypothetical protein